jgi:hypothetical protein
MKLDSQIEFLESLLYRMQCGQTLSAALQTEGATRIPPSLLPELKKIMLSQNSVFSHLEQWIHSLETQRDHQGRLDEVISKPRAQAIALSVVSGLVSMSLGLFSSFPISLGGSALSLLFWFSGALGVWLIFQRARRKTQRSQWIRRLESLAAHVQSGQTWGQALQSLDLRSFEAPPDSASSFVSLVKRAMEGQPSLEILRAQIGRENRKWLRESRALIQQTEWLLYLPLFLGFAPSVLIPILWPLIQLLGRL